MVNRSRDTDPGEFSSHPPPHPDEFNQHWVNAPCSKLVWRFVLNGARLRIVFSIKIRSNVTGFNMVLTIGPASPSKSFRGQKNHTVCESDIGSGVGQLHTSR